MELKSFFAQDKDGGIVPGAYVYLYIKGTTTPVYGIEGPDGNVLDNPFQATADGLIQLSAPDGVYDLRVTSAGLDKTIPVSFLDTTEALDTIQAASSQTSNDADRAEAARDAAQLTARVFADTASGLASTVEDEYFTVPSSSDDEILILYRHDAGPTAVEVGRYPSEKKLAPLLNITPEGSAFSIVDGAGQAAIAVRDDGTVDIASINGKNVNELLSETTNAGALVTRTPEGYAFALLDQYGMAALGVKEDGTFEAKSLQADSLNGVALSTILSAGSSPSVSLLSRFPSEINMVLSYGQSLSTGTSGTPSISLTQRFDNLRFEGGVRSQDSADPYTAFVPLVEQDNGPLGETPVSGATDAVKELIFLEDGLEFTDHSFQLLGSAPGAGGTAIAGLSIGTGPYNRFMNDVQAGYDLAQAEGRSFKVGAFFWTQAESDYINSTPKETYKTAFVKLRNDLESEVQAVTGQSEPLACISYQVNGHSVYGHSGDPYLAVAQLEVSRENANHYVACPLYWSPQKVHQSAENYKRLGAYYGLAYKRIVVDGQDWKPLQPEQVDHQGRIILIRFHVPKGELTFDTTLIGLRADYGFQVVDDQGAAIAIDSVTIVGPDTLKLLTATAIPAGGRVQYAFNDGGNLRDQQGDSIVFDPNGLNFPLHNWCVIFDEAL